MNDIKSVSMIYIKSRYVPNIEILNWTLGIVFISYTFLYTYIPASILPKVQIWLAFLYLILLVWSIIHALFEPMDKDEFDRHIRIIEECNSTTKGTIQGRRYNFIRKARELRTRIFINEEYLHVPRTCEYLTSQSSIRNYALIIFILFASQFSFDHIKPGGPTIFLLISLVTILYCLFMIFRNKEIGNKLISVTTFGFMFLAHLSYTFGKHSYTRNYGNEVIGSYFEKPNYRTKYYVNVFQKKDNDKNYRLPALIHVFLDTEYDNNNDNYFGIDQEQSSTSKNIALEEIILPNGDKKHFSECQLEMWDKVYCTDQDNQGWYLELTNIKIPTK